LIPLEQAALAFQKADRAFKEAHAVFREKHPELLLVPFDEKRAHPDYGPVLEALTQSMEAKDALAEVARQMPNYDGGFFCKVCGTFHGRSQTMGPRERLM
jgi:hypothetical protein